MIDICRTCGVKHKTHFATGHEYDDYRKRVVVPHLAFLKEVRNDDLADQLAQAQAECLMLRNDLDRCHEINRQLANRVAVQSQAMSRRAEKPEDSAPLIKLLKSLEWEGRQEYGDNQSIPSCPCCYGIQESWHRDGCELYAAIDTDREPDRCHAQRDGDCIWTDCPQNRDGEPAKSGRGCPLPQWEDEE